MILLQYYVRFIEPPFPPHNCIPSAIARAELRNPSPPHLLRALQRRELNYECPPDFFISSALAQAALCITSSGFHMFHVFREPKKCYPGGKSEIHDAPFPHP